MNERDVEYLAGNLQRILANAFSLQQFKIYICTLSLDRKSHTAYSGFKVQLDCNTDQDVARALALIAGGFCVESQLPLQDEGAGWGVAISKCSKSQRVEYALGLVPSSVGNLLASELCVGDLSRDDLCWVDLSQDFAYWLLDRLKVQRYVRKVGNEADTSTTHTFVGGFDTVTEASEIIELIANNCYYCIGLSLIALDQIPNIDRNIWSGRFLILFQHYEK